MAEKIDFYKHWSQAKPQTRKLLDREIKAIQLIKRINIFQPNFLDIGCGDGNFLFHLKKIFPYWFYKGIDFSDSELKIAKSKNLNVFKANIEEKIPLHSESVDIIYAGEVIEHLYSPDLFLSETNRILKENGFLVLSTPNLCAWFNRILLPLGIQPIFLEPSTKSKLVGAGILKKLKKDSNPVGHVRIFTIDALKDLLEMNGFKLIKAQGALFEEGLPKSALWLDSIFSLKPSLSSNLILLAKKVKKI